MIVGLLKEKVRKSTARLRTSVSLQEIIAHNISVQRSLVGLTRAGLAKEMVTKGFTTWSSTTVSTVEEAKKRGETGPGRNDSKQTRPVSLAELAGLALVFQIPLLVTSP